MIEGKGGDKANQFLWTTLSETCLYAAHRIPEIADRVIDVDHAMQWGFGWELGPFEIWDAIGVERMARALEREGKKLPATRRQSDRDVRRNHSTKWRKGPRDISTRPPATHQAIEEPAGIIILKSLKERTGVVQENSGASLVDLGDGVLCCEFHSKMNAIGSAIS